MRLAVVADDLTGALDASAPFAQRGARTVLALAASGATPDDADVVAFDTRSRHLAAPQAAAAVAACVLRLAPGVRVLKKIDSTLRGPVVAEIRAAAHAAGDAVDDILIAPAVPEHGRIVRAGRVLVNGQALERTEYARDARSPAFVGNLCAALAPYVARMPDCADASDMLAIARSAGPRTLLVGAAGLARALAAAWSGPGRPQNRAPCASVLAVIGSRAQAASRQLAALRRARQEQAVLAAPESLGEPDAIAADLGMAAAREMQEGAHDSLLLTGGDTARAVLAALGIDRLDIDGEILPGIPVATACWRGRRLAVATKAGGFGGDDALIRAIDALTSGR
ncbi:MAG: four-carbon acid sugar kinase family protein [Alphaproteobacteria bacterium]|nr:four-carbon acid sugar kinase family protein [Alphaproteobacteria bacterium]